VEHNSLSLVSLTKSGGQRQIWIKGGESVTKIKHCKNYKQFIGARYNTNPPQTIETIKGR
jgi:hypothetical protein